MDNSTVGTGLLPADTAERAPAWAADTLLPGFEALALRFPDDYDGPVVATLVRRRAETPTRRAVLYVHGFIDYFFQEHLAAAYNAHGYNFYALDLRKYGRSLGTAAHPNFCKAISEYFSDISAAISVISEAEGNDYLVLNGHSTGGLTTALYAHSGTHRARVRALILNSPFFAFNTPAGSTKVVLRLIGALGRVAPLAVVRGALSPVYGQSIHRNYHGEWAFDTRFKPIEGFPAYFGWIRAILAAQRQVRAGLDITCPVLLLHSDKSVYGKEWRPDFQVGDGVLNVADMRAAVPHLGPVVTEVEIADGMHDLVLSRADVRARVFAEMFAWLDRVNAGAAG